MNPRVQDPTNRKGARFTAGRARKAARHLLPRLVVFGLIWWAMTQGEMHHPVTAGLIVAVSSVASLALVPPGIWSIRFAALPRFLPYFLGQSLLGGIDVAMRALRRSMGIRARVIEYPLNLQRQSSRVFFLWVVSLLPGTASVSIEGQTAFIHVLDERQPQGERLRTLEGLIGRLFGEDSGRSSSG